ncbi:MAG: class I SAM-dependent methyltransferase [Candidatus Omnitrophica bacterium]|nr:class I SAM-dependent methyltransferase [Candidatus Omnitrophota bacterium]
MKTRNFDKDAQSWDDSPLRTGLARDVATAVSKQVELSKDMDVLDFGCGTGLLAFHILPHVRSITGVDTSKGMLDVFLAKARQQKADNVKAYLLDLALDDGLAGPYHFIMSSMTLHHVQDTRKLLEQFYKVLRPGGQIAIADLDEEGGRFHDNSDGVFHNGFDREKLGLVFLEAGFVNITSIAAAQINKPDSEGRERAFSVFLMTGRK